MSSGFQTALVISEESSFGVPAGNAVKMPITKPGVKASQNLITDKALLNEVNPRIPSSGNRMSSGSVEADFALLTAPWWFKWVNGNISSVAAGTGTGYLINNGAGYPVGGATLVVDGGSGTIPVGSFVSIGGNLYRVNTQVGGATVTSISIDGGLIAAVLDNAAVTVTTLKGHKSNLTTATMQSLTFEEQHPDATSYLVNTGCYLGKMDLRIQPEGICMGTFSVEGKHFAPFAATQVVGSVVTPVHTAFEYFGCRVYVGTNSLLLYAKELNISISRSLDTNQFVIDGTGERYEIPGGIAVVEGSLKALYPSDVLLQLANAGTETSIRVISRYGTTGYMGIYLPEVRFKLDTPDVASEAVVELTLPFMAYYQDNVDATAIQATFANSQANYTAI